MDQFFGGRPRTHRLVGTVYVPDDDEAPVVEAIYERFLAGENINSITTWLNGESVPPPLTKSSAWNYRTVKRILESPTSCGMMGNPHSSERKLAANITPIVSVSQWQRVRALLRDMAQVQKASNRNREALFSGLLVCGACGGPLYRYNTHNRMADGTKAIRSLYRCKNTKGREGGRCTQPGIREDDLYYRLRGVLPMLLAWELHKEHQTKAAEEVARMEADRDSLVQQQDDLLGMWRRKEIVREVFEKHNSGLKVQIDQIDRELDDLEETLPSMTVEEQLNLFADPAQVRIWLRRSITSLTILDREVVDADMKVPADVPALVKGLKARDWAGQETALILSPEKGAFEADSTSKTESRTIDRRD